MDLFEIATRKKYRFDYYGSLTVEDLWELKDEGIDAIYNDLKGQEEQSTDSLFAKAESKDQDLVNKIEIIKYIAAVKKAEREEAEKAQEKAQMKQKILAIKKLKQDKKLEEMSEEDLDKLLEGL